VRSVARPPKPVRTPGHNSPAAAPAGAAAPFTPRDNDDSDDSSKYVNLKLTDVDNDNDFDSVDALPTGGYVLPVEEQVEASSVVRAGLLLAGLHGENAFTSPAPSANNSAPEWLKDGLGSSVTQGSAASSQSSLAAAAATRAAEERYARARENDKMTKEDRLSKRACDEFELVERDRFRHELQQLLNGNSVYQADVDRIKKASSKLRTLSTVEVIINGYCKSSLICT